MKGKRAFQWQASIDSAQRQQHAAEGGANGPTEATAPHHLPVISGRSEKSVLLVDSNRQNRESRAKVMRTMGVRVDCAASAYTARVRLANEKYNLILVDLGRDVAEAESLVSEIRTRNSRQLVGFLVGSPLFVAQSLDERSSNPISIDRPSTRNAENEQEKVDS